MTKKEFEKQRKLTKMYKVGWERVIFDAGNIRTVKYENTLVAKNFLDAMAKSCNEFDFCKVENILSMTFMGFITIPEDESKE